MFTFILIILSLIFLVPSSGLSLIFLAAYLFIKFKTKHSKVESFIVHIARKRSGGYCVDVQYSDVLGYAQGNERIINIQGEMVTFMTNIKGIEYEVRINREPLGRRAIIEAIQCY